MVAGETAPPVDQPPLAAASRSSLTSTVTYWLLIVRRVK
jgi:hypothetical protein